ncbi:MAG: aminoacetone oxidase family FAD-binding enzyme [Lachnospira sp.]|nr:aminoacetone oxidase family FAD-binding enzyme [Lachnospira sp.]
MGNQKIYDCAVIGGGAAGMLAAIRMGRNGLNVILIEHTKKIGNKILQTGNGKCNFTNLRMEEDCYLGDNQREIMSVIERFNQKAVISFFESIGVYHRERNGYVYPHSDTALSLQNALRMEIEHLKIRVSTEFDIREIKRNGRVFELMGDSYTYYANTVLLATGSKAAPKSGSDGSGYELAKKLGHQVVKPLPALVQLVSNGKTCRMMAGVRSQGTVKLFIDDRLAAEEFGELQYTDYGISGIPVFQLSRYAVKAVDEKRKVHLVIDMLPDYSEEYIMRIVETGIQQAGFKNMEQFMEGILNRKLVSAAVEESGISLKHNITEIGSEKVLAFMKQLKSFTMQITGFKDFDSAQVCQGGVKLSEIDMSTMMSMKVPGLFFAGEILDVDGKCGGYNLQWAWSSGAAAAVGVEKFLK